MDKSDFEASSNFFSQIGLISHDPISRESFQCHNLELQGGRLYKMGGKVATTDAKETLPCFMYRYQFNMTFYECNLWIDQISYSIQMSLVSFSGMGQPVSKN